MHLEIETVWEKYTIIYSIFRFPDDNSERKCAHTYTEREGLMIYIVIAGMKRNVGKKET